MESGAQANWRVNRLVTQAQELGPKDPLTFAALAVAGVLRFVLLLPTLVLTWPITFILGIAVQITFGLLLFPLSFIWIVFLGWLLGSSWVWLRVPILRPFLLIPGALLGTLAFEYAGFVPDMGEKYQKVLKMALADQWPYSYLLFRLSLEETGE